MSQPTKLEPHASASLSRTISEEDVVAFAHLTGDVNPLHLDEAYAKGTRFGQRVAHGVFAAGLVSAVIGTRLPGPGAIYLSQSLKFTAPVFIGDTVTATVTVLRAKGRVYTLETLCTNERGERVLEGEAVVLFEAVKSSGE